FMLVREGNKIRFRLNKSLGFFGGLATCMPKDTHKLMNRFMVFILGGPVASLVFALLMGLALYVSKADVTQVEGFLTDFFFKSSLLVSGGIFLTSIIPMQSAGFYSDGARVLQLLRGGAEAKINTTLMTTMAQLMAGTRPSQLNTALLEEAIALPIQSFFKSYCHYYLYLAYFDANELSKADVHLENALTYKEQLPKFYPALLYLEKAFFVAVTERNALAARTYFTQAKRSNLIPKHTFLKAEAAVLWAENKPEEAHERAQKALTTLKKSNEQGAAAFEKEWLEKITNSVIGLPHQIRHS
ncbi:MAG: hypothetical protein H7Y04_11415, partial [Verrucomicrobia bacterium]|nr:hypothetical protein [Cytophagales bacterium]